MSQPTSTKNKIVVGIDFGTTFSGIAWAKVGDYQVNVIQQWPGDNAPSSEKVPTQIVYDKKSTESKWGYQIPSMAPRYQGFKLDLDPQNRPPKSSLSKEYKDSKAMTQDKTHTPEQLTADYLKLLKAHLLSTLGRELGAIQAREVSLEFFLTVPAVWSDLTREKTLAAANEAGLGDKAPLQMMSEPEAAAMYVLHRRKLHNLCVGDTFVVCDAGGGTVDLISYTVTKLDPFIEVKESAPGSGGLCGGTYLNGRFETYLNYKLGAQPGWDKEASQDAMNDFEVQVKWAYSTTTANQTYTVSVPGLRHNAKLGINKRGKLILKPEEINEVFEPIIEEVVKMVLSQIKATNAKVKSVVLVGGFGSSQYLQERIQAVVESTVEVIKPPYGWSAVVQGAVLKGLVHNDSENAPVRLASRAARKHIGLQVKCAFDRKIHLESKKFHDPFDGIYKIRIMKWFIKKSDAITEDTPFIFTYTQKWLVSEGREDLVRVYIYCGRTDRAPVNYRDHQVKELVQLKADVSSIPESSFCKKRGKDGEMYYSFDYSIKVTYQSAHTKYDLIHDGKHYGSVKAEYA